MRLTVSADRVYVNIAPDHPGERHRTTNPLGKYGVRCDWDGHGGLLGIEIPVTPGEEVELDLAAATLTPWTSYEDQPAPVGG
jgi:hypothetical protein